MDRWIVQLVRTCRALVVLSGIGLIHAATGSAAPMPDLIVSDFWETKGAVYVTLENIGDAPAPAGHSAFLGVNGHQVDSAYIGVAIAAGKTYTTKFNQYSWQCTVSGQYTVAVVADGTNKVAESNEKNNIRQEVWTCDVTAPVITFGPLVMYVTQTSAKVSWTTDEASDSVVRYGLSHGTYTWTKSSAPRTTDHQIFLDGLTPDTRYYLVVESTDDADNTVRSKELTFRTEAPPKLPDLVVTEIWEQDRRIHCWIKNSGDGPAGPGHCAGLSLDGNPVDAAYVLVGLEPGASVQVSFAKFTFVCSAPQHVLRVAADMYDVIVESNETNNAMEKTVVCDVVAPKILWGPQVEDITTTSVTIHWQTDENSDSVVRYGIFPNQYPYTKSSVEMTTDHKVALGGLHPDTRYYFVVESTDPADNMVRSKEQSFRTAPELPDLIIADLWEQEHVIHIRVQNIGPGAAGTGHRAGLYVADHLVDSLFVAQSLASGEWIDLHFEKFYFRCFEPEQMLRAAADIDGQVDEDNESNNTLDKVITCDAVPLRITSGPSPQGIGATSATIVWETNKASDSTVLYDDHAGLFGQQAARSIMTTKHDVTFKGLTADTVYQFKVRSTDASGQSVSSRPGYFRTLPLGGKPPSKLTGVTFLRRDTEFPSYQMEAWTSEDADFDKVQFFLDGELIHTDYSAPYEATLAPGILGRAYAEFFRPHPFEARAVQAGSTADRFSGLFEPVYECNEVIAEFERPYRYERVYIPGETAPAGTEVLIQVYACTWEMNCVFIGRHLPGRDSMVCNPELTPIREVRFYVNGFPIGTVPSSADHTYAIPWDAGGYPLGTHVIRADAVSSDECIRTITRDIRIEQGTTELELTRRVWREENAFRIELRVRNLGTLDYACDVIRDNVDGLQPIAETHGRYRVVPRASADGRRCDVDLDLFDGAIESVQIWAGSSFIADYYAVPIQFPGPGSPDYAIGHDSTHVRDYWGLHVWTFERPCVRTEDGILLSVEVQSAIAAADYLIVTNPQNCGSEFGTADDVLSQMAKLAYCRRGTLGYLSGTSSNSAVWVRDQIRDWGANVNGGGYLSGGYLLLVGETEILPAWTVDIPDIEWSNADATTEVPLSDLPYADMSGSDNVPELIVGRIIGNDSGALIQAMQASLEGGSGRSFGVVTSGSEGEWENFVGNAYNIFSLWTGIGAGGEIMTGDHLLHHWSAYVQKEQLVSGHDFPMGPGSGFVTGVLAGTGMAAVRVDPHTDRAYVAAVGDLGLISTAFTSQFACPFDPGDALAAGDIDGDGEDEIIVASIARDRIIITCDPPNTTSETYLEFEADLEPWAVVACGRLFDSIPSEQVVVARTVDGGTVDIYEYVSSPPGLYRTWRLDIPFTAYDGLTIADVNSANPGDEIVIGRDDDNRVYVYSRTGNLIANFPCDPYTRYDGMVVGDLDGDGLDEIAVLIDDTVDNKRRLKIFESDCWFLDPSDQWQLKDKTSRTIYSRFLHFDGARTTGGSSGGDTVACRDIDGDGKDEILIANERLGRLYVIDGHYSRGWKDRYMPVLQAVDDQINVFALSGHGSPGTCSPFEIADIGMLSLDAHPLVFALSCLTGNYEGAGDNGLAEAFFAQGAGAYIGATEVSASSRNAAAGPGFFGLWGPSASAGAAFHDYRRACASSGENGWRFWALEYNYYGDPKYGAVGSAVAATAGASSISMAASEELPGLGEPIIVPDYVVETADGVDCVTIPGGELLIEGAMPIVPCYRRQWRLPPGVVVQDVTLGQRSGLVMDVGLRLPVAMMTVDSGDPDLLAQAPPAPGWYPAEDLRWNLIPNGDGSTTLVVLVHPFFYNSLTTEVRFYRDYVIDVETVFSDAIIVSLSTDQPLYESGDVVTIDVALNTTGRVGDAIVDATVRQYGSDDLMAGLLLTQLDGLSGPASLTKVWETAGALPGLYYVDLRIATPIGDVLDTRTCLFMLVSADPEEPKATSQR